jgi:hypothetical protein
LLWVLPQTQGFARWWADILPITVFQQAVQMMVLRLGSALMLELTPGSLSNALLTLLPFARHGRHALGRGRLHSTAEQRG